jgi:uncharacterized protein YggE
MPARRLALLVLGAALLAPTAPAAAQDPTTLVVVETASVRATPDTATVAAQISRRGRTGATARRLVERRVRQVLAALDALGVARADVQTTSIERYRSRRRGRVRHVASTTLVIRTTDLENLPRILGALGGASIEGPEFSVSDSTAARQEATAIALQRARRRADAAAAAVGMRVVAIRKVDLNPEFGYDASPDRASGGSDDSASGGGSGGGVIVEPGREEVAVAVAVVYEIAP